jgi:hypothetical protein
MGEAREGHAPLENAKNLEILFTTIKIYLFK